MTELEFLDALTATRDDGLKWRLDSLGRIRGTMKDGYLDALCPITAVCMFSTERRHSKGNASAAARLIGIKFVASVMSAADNIGAGRSDAWRKMLLSALQLET